MQHYAIYCGREIHDGGVNMFTHTHTGTSRGPFALGDKASCARLIGKYLYGTIYCLHWRSQCARARRRPATGDRVERPIAGQTTDRPNAEHTVLYGPDGALDVRFDDVQSRRMCNDDARRMHKVHILIVYPQVDDTQRAHNANTRGRRAQSASLY